MNNTITLKQIMEQNPQLSLKKIADSLQICYQYVLKTSKKPIANVPYDEKSVNYEEVERIIRRKKPLEEVDFEAMAASVKVYNAIPEIDKFELNTKFSFRTSSDVFEVIYKTTTHIVFIQANETQPRVMNFDTFLHQGPKMVA